MSGPLAPGFCSEHLGSMPRYLVLASCSPAGSLHRGSLVLSLGFGNEPQSKSQGKVVRVLPSFGENQQVYSISLLVEGLNPSGSPGLIIPMIKISRIFCGTGALLRGGPVLAELLIWVFIGSVWWVRSVRLGKL